MLERKRVSTDTITRITSAPGFVSPGAASAPPSAEELIEKIDAELAAVEQQAVHRAERAPSDDGVKTALERIQVQRRELEIIVSNVPLGFDLAPVFYSKIPADKGQKIFDEYSIKIRSKFLIFLAENHAKDLKAFGICANGIKRMRQGLDPANKKGDFYDLSIDHIVERAGCGLWADEKALDPDRDDATPHFRANHFGNLILLPEKIHQFKNTLNTLQKVSTMQVGEGRWVLMLIPRRGAVFKGFVCPPQRKDYPYRGIDMRPPDFDNKLNHASFMVAQTGAIADKILDHGLMAANQNAPRKEICRAFNGAAALDQELRQDLSRLKSHLIDTGGFLCKVFSHATVKKPHLDAFVKFYEDKKLRSLRATALKLPFDEAADLHKALLRLDREVERALAPKPKKTAANDNKKAKKPPVPSPSGRR